MLSRYPFKFLALLLGILVVATNLNAQTPPPPYVPNVFPPSPNAASLMKFTDVPVSPYTGTADVSIPFYTIQAKGLSIPVSIAYHTGGIRLAEDAGVVGLGWALNAGGMISRTVRDKDDLLSDYFSGVLPLKPGDLSFYQTATAISPELQSTPFNANKYLFCFTCSYKVNMASGDIADYSGVFSTASSGTSTSDTEPDSYSYNFAGHSGKFIIRPDRTIVLEKQDNIRIKINAGSGGGSIGYITFTITDENGNSYYFNAMEFGGTLSDASTLSSWHLSKIVTQQNDVINFNYVQTGWINVPQSAMETYRGANCDGDGFHYSPNITSVYSNYKLQSIDFTDGRLLFSYEDGRFDLTGGSKLTAVKVYSKSKAGLKFIKENDLYYSYFNGTGTSVNVEKARLRLDSVKETGTGLSAKPYSFVYNTLGADNAGKYSKSIDHWGFYNGAGNTTLIPSQSIHYAAQGIVDTQLDFTGANREASSLMDVFSLKQITYPTGGKSVFEFSPNEYDYDKSIVGVNEFPQMEIVTLDTMVNISSYGTTSGTFDLKSVVSGTDVNVNVAFISKSSQGWPFQDRSGYGRAYFTLGSTQVDLSSSSLSCGGPACSTSITAYAYNGTPSYSWHAYVDSSIPTTDFSLIHVLVQYKAYRLKARQANGLYIVQAGGLKLNSITDYSSDGVAAKKRVWQYSYTSTNGYQYSYGRLMSMPSYAHLEPTTWHQGVGVCRAIVLFSSSNTGLSSAIQDNIVGYSRVNEYIVDPVTNENIGKTEYNFFNSPDSTIFYNGYRMPGTLNMGNHLNGSLLSTRIFRNTAGAFYKVKETYNYYHTANRIVYFIPKYELPIPYNYYGVFPGVCNGNVAIPVAMYALFYPLIKSERVLQDSTLEITYAQNDTTKYLMTGSKSYYDNPLHYQLTRSSATDDKGNLHVSRITYPQDYITSGGITGNTMLDTLIRRNMVATAIEKRDSLYYKGSSAGYVTGASLTGYRQLSSGTVVSDKVYKLDLIRPVIDFAGMSVSGNTVNQDSRYRQLINFDAYDDKNNIAQYTVIGQLPTSIIWDYRKMLPIAQVKNADSLSVAYTSFEEEGTGHWTVASSLRDSVTAAFSGYKSYNLSNGNITKGGLTAATTYVISYWTRNAAPLTIAGTVTGYPVTGATINGWTYYEHQVTGQTAITVSGTGNIDELRLYPKGAQMTTYTYSPLIGMTSATDAKNQTTYYEYDSFQRLMNIKDYQGNIVKNYDYNYRPQ
jgi:YD repeat-containing protein